MSTDYCCVYAHSKGEECVKHDIVPRMMTVKRLKERLQDVPDDLVVIVQQDSEGNGYSPLSGCYTGAIYKPTGDWGGDVLNLSDSADSHCMTEKKWIHSKAKYPHCLVLYPTN